MIWPDFHISLSLTDQSFNDKEKQEASPTLEEGVKVEDAPKQKDKDDGTAGKSDFLSVQPPTEPMVLLTTVCVVSQHTSLISHRPASHIPSLPLSPTYLLSIFHCQIHKACTHNRHTRKISTHPHAFLHRQCL